MEDKDNITFEIFSRQEPVSKDIEKFVPQVENTTQEDKQED